MRSISLLLIPLATMFVQVQVAQAVANDGTDKAKKAAQKKAHGKKAQRGKASYYGPEFTGKKMAGGERFDPKSNSAASKTLPLGTKAKVTNLETGKSKEVVIEDRGPYVEGRIIDVTPKTAEQLEFKKEGVAPVKVQPLEVPKPDKKKETPAAPERK